MKKTCHCVCVRKGMPVNMNLETPKLKQYVTFLFVLCFPVWMHLFYDVALFVFICVLFFSCCPTFRSGPQFLVISFSCYPLFPYFGTICGELP